MSWGTTTYCYFGDLVLSSISYYFGQLHVYRCSHLTHREEAVAISFNGGKDCASLTWLLAYANVLSTGTVLLHLYAGVLYSRHIRTSSEPSASTPATSEPATPQSRPTGSLHGESSKSKPNGHMKDVRSNETPTSGANSSQENAQVDGPTQLPPPLPASSPSVPGSQTPPSATHHKPHDASSAILYPPIKSIYITAPDPFPALETFVLESTERYGLDLYRFGGGMKAALEEYLGCGGGKGVKGVLVGTRRGDPNGGMCPLYWCRALRVNRWPSLMPRLRCRATSTHRPIMAAILTHTSYSVLVILGRLGVSAGTGRALVHVVRPRLHIAWINQEHRPEPYSET